MPATYGVVIHEFRRPISHALLICALLSLAACGGGSNVAKGTSQNGTNLTVTFASNVFPTAVAEKFGDGAWSAAAVPTTNPLNVVLPQGTTNYSLAYVCPQFTVTSPFGSTVQNAERVIEATVSDGTTYTVSCIDNPPTGAVTGTVSASSLAGATSVEIIGEQSSFILSENSGAVTGSLATSTKDIAVVAFGELTLPPVGVQILRSQSVPGAINGGSPVTLTSADATTLQPLAVSGVPAGFRAPFYDVAYLTTNGTYIPLGIGPNSQYAAVPSSMSASGDLYRFTANSILSSNGYFQGVSATQIGASAGPITLNLPSPLTVQAPVAAAFPSFTVNYSGSSGNSAIVDGALISWGQTTSTAYEINVSSTESFQGGSTNVTIPDLTSLPGFLAPAPSGTTVSWFVIVSGGSSFPFMSFPGPGSWSSASDSGNYTEP